MIQKKGIKRNIAARIIIACDDILGTCAELLSKRQV